MNYTQDEIDALDYYSSRKSQGFWDTSFNYTSLNGLLRYLTRDKEEIKTLPRGVRTPDDLKAIINKIFDLFTLSCKYGYTHIIPWTIYRGDENAATIDDYSKMDDMGYTNWNTDSFFSCSKSKSETDVFSGPQGPKIILNFDEHTREMKQVPFIDVNAILGSHEYYGDEKEILLPPFVECTVEYSSPLEYRLSSFGSIFPDFVDTTKYPSLYEDFVSLNKKVKTDPTSEDIQELDAMREHLRLLLHDTFSYASLLVRNGIEGKLSEEELEQELQNLKSETLKLVPKTEKTL